MFLVSLAPLFLPYAPAAGTSVEDSCYETYGRYSMHKDGSVGGDYNVAGNTKDGELTLEQCKDRCEDGTWDGCAGFSRESWSLGVNDLSTCFWVNNTNMYWRSSPSDKETLFTRDAKGFRNATHDNMAGCCYRGMTTTGKANGGGGNGDGRGFCDGNNVECTVDCGLDSLLGQSWILLSAAQHYPPAMVQLGEMYYYGNKNIKRDRREAYTHYFGPAALAGHQVAQFYIGNAFERGGYGYATDARQAYMWYTLAMEKAVAVGDKKHKNKANTSRTTLTTGDPPFCDAECQTDAQAMSNKWVAEPDSCKLTGVEETRASFCSNHGDPLATPANDAKSNYTSCGCTCDKGYYPDPTGSVGCVDGTETTSTTRTKSTTTSSTYTKSCADFTPQEEFYGPYDGLIGEGLSQPDADSDRSFVRDLGLRECALACAQMNTITTPHRKQPHVHGCDAFTIVQAFQANNVDGDGKWENGVCMIFSQMALRASNATDIYPAEIYRSFIRDTKLCIPKSTSARTTTTTTTAQTTPKMTSTNHAGKTTTPTPSAKNKRNGDESNTKWIIMIVVASLLCLGLGVICRQWCTVNKLKMMKSRKYGGAELLVNEDYGDAYDMGHSTLRMTSETVTNA